MPQPISIDDACFEAAELISQSDGLLITAGAGLGIDSGLPDFRGDNGFWKAYPALGDLGMRFFEVANPKAFVSMPAVAAAGGDRDWCGTAIPTVRLFDCLAKKRAVR